MRATGVLAVLGAALALAHPADAQQRGVRLGLTLEGAATTSSGGIRATVEEPEGTLAAELTQGASGAFAVRADLEHGRWRVEFGAQYVPAELAIEFTDGTRIGGGGVAAGVAELVPRLGYRFLGTADGGALRLLAGPSLQYWSVDLTDSRVTVALGVDLQLEAPLAERLRLAARGGITRGPSFLGSDDGVKGLIEATGVTRWQGGIGLRWRVGS
jgi:hypothetical protein